MNFGSERELINKGPIETLEQAVIANVAIGIIRATEGPMSYDEARKQALRQLHQNNNNILFLARLSAGLAILNELEAQRKAAAETEDPTPDPQAQAPAEEIIFINQSSYAPWGSEPRHRKITLVVEAITDMVPGAWHHPIDLINHIRKHPYVRAVRFTPDPEKDQAWLKTSSE